MKTTSFTTAAPSDQTDLVAIERRRKLAEALQAESMQAIPQQAVGAGQFATPISPFQGAAKLAQAFAARTNERKADEAATRVAERREALRNQDMGTLATALQGRAASPGGLVEDASGNVTQADPIAAQTPQQRLAQSLSMIRDPAVQQIALGIVGKQNDPYTLKPGERRIQNGAVIAEGATEKPAGPTPPRVAAPGSAIIDDKGNILRTVPDRSEGKPPPGYRITKDGNLEAIPGGPADQKIAGQFNQDTAALTSTNANMDRLATAANEVLNHPGLGGITGLRGKIPNVPGSDAANAQALLDTLKSQVAFGVLQDMRNNSKTGGTLGNVSDAEGRRLESNLAALANSQSKEQMQDSLRKIITYTEGAKDRMREAFNLKHGGQGGLPTKPGERPVPMPVKDNKKDDPLGIR